MEARINLITLGVADVARSARFYETIFGQTRSAHSNAEVAFIQLGGLVLSLFGRSALAHDAQVADQTADFKGYSIAYNARSEAEVDAAIAEIVTAGGRLVKTPQKVFWGGYSGYVADFDNHLIEVAYNPFFPMNDRGELQV